MYKNVYQLHKHKSLYILGQIKVVQIWPEQYVKVNRTI